MIIKLLKDNTVHVRYNDGTSQTINSTHSHKARNDLVKQVCDAFPYKGAMQFTDDFVPPVFEFDRPEDCPEPLKTAMGAYHTELCDLKAKLDAEEDKQATEAVTVEVEEVEIVDGKAVVKKVTKTKEQPVFDELPCVDEDGNDICDLCGTTHVEFPITKPKTVKVPRMIEGKKVSQEDKDRLNELLGEL